MAIGGAAVWATPMMTSVASAQEAPSCDTGILDWDNFAINSLFTSTVIGNTTVSMGISGVTNTTLLATNRRVQAGPAGGVNQRSLRFEMTPDNANANNGSRQTITFSFSNPVSNVAFSIYDIDTVAGSWGDRVVMNTSGYTFSRPAGSNVIGNGNNTPTNDNNPATGRFRNSNGNDNPGGNDNRGNLNIFYAGPITSFNFTYRNQGESGGNNQLINLSDIRFTC
jgi:hypothetical protein